MLGCSSNLYSVWVERIEGVGTWTFSAFLRGTSKEADAEPCSTSCVWHA